MQAVHIVQKNLINIKLPLISALALLSISFSAAAVYCHSDYPLRMTTSTINVATSYAGNDLPVGSVIYRNQVMYTDKTGFTCSGSFNFDWKATVSSMPYGPSSILNSTRTISVFPTNISGVGIALFNARTGAYFSEKNSITIVTGGIIVPEGSPASSSSNNNEISMELIKTGPITSGSIVQGSSFPTVVVVIPDKPGFTGLPMTLRTVNWQGTIIFTTSTCTIPNVNVDMGAWDISRISTTIGSTSAWVDSSIVLQNCPTFSGLHSSSSSLQTTQDTGTASGTIRSPTLMTVSLTANTAIVDSNNSVYAVNATGSTASAATGIGIQLGYSTDINASPTLPTTIWKSGTTWNITPPNDGRSSFKIPLAARYYKTSKSVTPGPANASVTFNIDYK